MKLSKIKLNPNNPRLIKDDKFKKLVKSIQEFPQMMELRPIIIDNQNMILGGNMRFRALKELGYKEVPDNWVKKADELTEEQKREFIIKDNVGFGEWDFDMLANEWETDKLDSWGIDGVHFEDMDIIFNDVGDSAKTAKVGKKTIAVRIGKMLMFIDEAKDKDRADSIHGYFFEKYEKLSDSEASELEEKIVAALYEISSNN